MEEVEGGEDEEEEEQIHSGDIGERPVTLEWREWSLTSLWYPRRRKVSIFSGRDEGEEGQKEQVEVEEGREEQEQVAAVVLEEEMCAEVGEEAQREGVGRSLEGVGCSRVLKSGSE